MTQTPDTPDTPDSPRDVPVKTVYIALEIVAKSNDPVRGEDLVDRVVAAAAEAVTALELDGITMTADVQDWWA